MDIVSIRKLMEKKGCQVLLGAIALLMVLGMIFSVPFFSQGPEQGGDKFAIVTINGTKVDTDMFNAKINANHDQMGAGGGRGTPDGEYLVTGATLVQMVQESVIRALAKENGVVLNAETIKPMAQKMADEFARSQIAQMQMTGMIPMDATPAKIDEVLKPMLGGKTLNEWKGELTTQLTESYNDATRRPQIESQLMTYGVMEKFQSSEKYTEADLKNSYTDLTFQIIRFNDLSKDLTVREDDAIKALEEIKGGADFVATQKKYWPNSTEPDRQVTLPRATVESQSDLKSLLALKPGEVSEVINQNGSPALFKLTKSAPNLPKDFEKNKAELLRNAQQTRAQQRLQEAIEKGIDGASLTFGDVGLENLYASTRLLNDQEERSNQTEFKKKITELLDKVMNADPAKMLDPRFNKLTRYKLTEELYSISTTAERIEMVDSRLEAISGVLEEYEDMTLRMRAAQFLYEQKRYQDSHDFLLQVAQFNSDFEQMGESIYSQITQLNGAGLKEKNYTQEQHDLVKAELDRWLTEKAEYQKAAAEAKAEADAAAKEEAERLKKEEEELRKAEEAEKAGATGTGTTGSTTTPNSGAGKTGDATDLATGGNKEENLPTPPPSLLPQSGN